MKFVVLQFWKSPLDDDGAFPDGDAPPDQDVFEGDVPRAAEYIVPLEGAPQMALVSSMMLSLLWWWQMPKLLQKREALSNWSQGLLNIQSST